MELWEEILDFPGYAISDLGNVCHQESGKDVARLKNTRGVLYVHLNREGRQYSRSVAMLVAKHFDPPPYSRYDTIIHLDGDRMNCEARNLRWRPRSFAINYHRQFRFPYINRLDYEVSSVEIDNIYSCKVTRVFETFSNSWVPTIKFGLLERNVVLSALNLGAEDVFPTLQRFYPTHLIDTK